MNDFSKRLFELAVFFRVDKPSEFAKHVGISHQTATNYLKGIRTPSIDVIVKVQKSFEGLSIDWLLNGTGEMLNRTGSLAPDQNLIDLKDMEIDYLKKSVSDKEETIQSQKALILILSEKVGIDLTTDGKPSKGKKGRIQGFGAIYTPYIKMMISN